jgi:hypothetical protein
LSDSLYEDLGTICADDEDKSVWYLWEVATGQEECGLYDVYNVASFETSDTHAIGEDNWTVNVEILCLELGCTLTRGYWQTHSIYGPAPYDETWAAIGEDTTFYLSDQSWYEVMHTFF